MGRSMRGLYAVGEARRSLPCGPSVGLFSYRKRFECVKESKWDQLIEQLHLHGCSFPQSAILLSIGPFFTLRLIFGAAWVKLSRIPDQSLIPVLGHCK